MTAFTFDAADRALYEIFFAPTEPITEALAIELVARGFLPQELREAQDAGLVYNRRRNSFMTPIADWEA